MRSDLPRVPILMYHRIARPEAHSTVRGHYVPPRLFARQMKAMARLGYRAAPISQVFASDDPLPQKPFCVTFDDGYENFATNALPSLQRLGFTATVFLVTEMVDKDNAWDADRGDVRERLLTREQIAACQAAGTEFGSHTLTHADLTSCPKDEAWRQISESKSAVEKITGRPAVSFCYPYGRFTSETREMVEKAGYSLACATLKGLNTRDTDRFALKRINVRRDTTVLVLLMKLLRGAYLGR